MFAFGFMTFFYYALRTIDLHERLGVPKHAAPYRALTLTAILGLLAWWFQYMIDLLWPAACNLPS
jgi:hypothetical protein